MLKVSMVTISFNHAKYLEAAICSTTAQNYPACEYIVVDPGSTDGSREIINRHKEIIEKLDLTQTICGDYLIR